MRLAGKVALITGGAGTIGEAITRRYLQEGATVVITGRDVSRLQALRRRLIDEEGVAPARIAVLRMDGSDVAEVRAGVAEMVHGGPNLGAGLGRIDILVNNASSSGPRRPLADLPLTYDERDDGETLSQAVSNVLGVTWNMVRVVAPVMQPGASIINLSTIFSRTPDIGRAAYMVPKAALNALGQGLTRELGTRGIRVNTIVPGPVESERLHAALQVADTLTGQPAGSTAEALRQSMHLSRAMGGSETHKVFPRPLDVANTAVFLGSDEAAAFSGQALEVAHGMQVPAESSTTFVSRPGLRSVDANGKVVLIVAGDQVDDALALADVLRSCQASVVITFRNRDAFARAEQRVRDRRSHGPDDMYGRPLQADPPLLAYLDPLDRDGAAGTLARIREATGGPQHAVILPAFGVDSEIWKGEDRRAARSLLGLSDATLEAFLEQELVGAMALAGSLERFWREQSPAVTPDAPRVLFMSNRDDGAGNAMADVLRAATEELVRVWRAESQLRAEAADGASPAPAVWSNQLIRYHNDEPANLDFAAAWITKLLASARRIDEINLYLPRQIVATTGTHRPSFGWAESLFGLHLGKVALITGGSAGIGGQIGRLLALSGAFVVLAARGADQLRQIRDSIIREVRDAGYPNADTRVQILADADVSDPAALSRMVEYTLATFGRIDYLLNNAGIAGAEEMVIDMPIHAWQHTQNANLISNYALIRKVAPIMKRQGSGYIVNVSSYFGGEKYVAIPYPNRSDYAVSKAGQRAMVEALARFMGPEIQINAIAPGPVEGDRLRGTGERPGLFMRRAKLILGNKRLNDVHAALIEAHRESGQPVAAMLPALLRNNVEALLADASVSEALRRLAAAIWEQSDVAGSARTHLLDESIARKLIRRLVLGGHLTPEQVSGWQGDRMATGPVEVTVAGKLTTLTDLPPDPFWTSAQIEREARKVRDGIVGMLYLQRMPTEFDVALATVYYLADRNVTGETFHPSGGLKFDRTVTEGELFGKASPQRLEQLRGKTVFLVGEHLRTQLAALAQSFIEEYDVARVVLLTEGESAAREFLAGFPEHVAAGRLHALATGGDLERGFDQAVERAGRPGPVISTPFHPLPARPLVGSGDDWDQVLDEVGFATLVDQQLTHHFRVARKASLVEGANLVLVTPSTSARSSAEEFALANFIKTTLHAFTATIGAESERTAHAVPVNQVDLTRRARSEEPRNAAEEAEELGRFVQAVLLVAAPLPGPKESRYRARIYRGNAITV